MTGTKEHMKIILVDDHILFREGLANLLSAQPDITIIGSADNVAAAVERTAPALMRLSSFSKKILIVLSSF